MKLLPQYATQDSAVEWKPGIYYEPGQIVYFYAYGHKIPYRLNPMFDGFCIKAKNTKPL